MAAAAQLTRTAPPVPVTMVDRATCDGFLAGLLVSSHAAALIDSAGRVLDMRGDGRSIPALTLDVETRRLVGRTREASRRMGRMLDELLGCEPAGRSGLAILPAPGGAPLVVRGRRVCDDFVLPRVAAVLTFLDPGSCVLPEAALLQTAFGMTACEAGVALGIAAGQDLREIAVARGIVVPTVRSHLKSVFAKTQTHRQSALVALLLSLRTPSAPGGGRARRIS